MLERSKKSDLVREMTFRHSTPKTVLERMKDVITEHSARIREIELHGMQSSELATLLGGIPDSSLRLTSLVLATCSSRDYTLPISIMGDLQRLQYLHAYRRNSLSLALATALSIDPLGSTPLSQASPNYFTLSTLRAMPALQVLHLKDSVPETCAIGDVQPISLPNLQDLYLFSDILSHVLSVIVLPVETIVSLSTGPDDQFASSLSEFFSSMGFWECKKPSYRHVGVHISTSAFLTCRETSTGTSQLKLNFLASLLEEVVSSIPLHLSSLCLFKPVPAQILIQSFGKSEQIGSSIFDVSTFDG